MSIEEKENELSVYESMAARYDVAARKLEMDEGLSTYLRAPNREIIVHIPVDMDDGTLKVLTAIGCSTASRVDLAKEDCATPRTSLWMISAGSPQR